MLLIFSCVATLPVHFFRHPNYGQTRLTESQLNQTIHNQTKLILTRLNQNQPNETQLNQTQLNYCLKVLRNSCTDLYLLRPKTYWISDPVESVLPCPKRSYLRPLLPVLSLGSSYFRVLLSDRRVDRHSRLGGTAGNIAVQAGTGGAVLSRNTSGQDPWRLWRSCSPVSPPRCTGQIAQHTGFTVIARGSRRPLQS